jgi:putative glycosyltransferase
MRLIYNEAAEGWTSTLVSIWFIGGLLIFCIGIIGIYLSKMFLEIKNRPLSIVRKIYKKDN